MYHYIRDLKNSRYPNIKGLDISLFKKQIDFLTMQFNIVSMEEVITAFNSGAELPSNAALLTFDDGYADNYTYALPILKEHNIQGTFFIPGKTFRTHTLLDVNKIHYILASADINEIVIDVKKEMDYYRGSEYEYAPTEELYTQYAVANRFDDKDTIFVKRMLQTVLPEPLRRTISSWLFQKYLGISEGQLANELYMTEDQVRLMKREGMHIGLHGYDHYWLADLSLDKMKEDINLALGALDEFIDRNCWSIAYPYGNYSKDVIRFIRESGGVTGFTTKVDMADLDVCPSFEIPRFDCNDFPPKSDNFINFCKGIK